MAMRPDPPNLIEAGGGARHRREANSPAARRFQRAAHVGASPDRLFARLDDPALLAGHMKQRSAMMGGGRMTYALDEGRGQTVGSHIRMGGSAFGFELELDEMVVEHDPPRRKVVRTVGTPKLLVIGPYELGFEIDAEDSGARLRVWIAYQPADTLLGRRLGWLLAPLYARWCVTRMVADAVSAFRARPA
jgi:hypothetical protein